MSDHLRIRDLPLAEKPRERLMEAGADALDNASLLAILLRTGTKGTNVLRLAEQLLHKFRTLDGLARASIDELREIRGIGRDKAISLKSAFTLAQRMAREIRQGAPMVDTPAKIADLLREENRFYEVEHLQAVLLNTRRRLIKVVLVGQGTLDSVLVHPREVFKPAIQANAAAIVLVHNHPSGDPSPSEMDIKVTRDLIRAGQLLKIDVVDHIIIGRRTEGTAKDFQSLRELGYCFA
jgi:DNA repair protein RadC